MDYPLEPMIDRAKLLGQWAAELGRAGSHVRAALTIDAALVVQLSAYRADGQRGPADRWRVEVTYSGGAPLSWGTYDNPEAACHAFITWPNASLYDGNAEAFDQLADTLDRIARELEEGP